MSTRFWKDNRGASAIAYMLILPIFVLLIFGTFEVWRVMAVQQSLHLGVYKAVRKLSWWGPQWIQSRDAEDWESQANGEARSLVAKELDRNAFLPKGYTLQTQVFVEPDRRRSVNGYGWLFVVRAELVAPGLTPLLSPGSLTLSERQVSFIQRPFGTFQPWIEVPEDQAY